MNILSRFFCRTYQAGFRLAMPILPYRQPKVLNTPSQIKEVLKVNNIKNVLLVTDNNLIKLGLIKDIENALSDFNVAIFSDIQPNPTVTNIEQGVKKYLENNCEAIVVIGGGSPMDCAKVIGARVVKPKKSVNKMKGLLKVCKKLPLFVAVPTTAGTGSETTLTAVITDDKTHHKYTINDFSLIPHFALLDANLTLGLPKGLTATTGLDALTHAVEAFIGQSTTKNTRKCALQAIKLVFENLNECYKNGKNFDARKNMLTASYLAGIAFSKSYVGYVHAIAHSLGGKYGTPHGLANAIILPTVLNHYGKAVHKKIKKIAIYLGLCDKKTKPEEAFNLFMEELTNLNTALEIPTFVQELKKKDIEALSVFAAKEANPLYPVPVLYNKLELQEIYKKLIGKKDGKNKQNNK